MRGWHLKPLPAALLAATVAFELAAVGLSWDLESRYDTLLYAFYSVVQVAAGAFVASRHPRNPIGWLFCGFGALNALTADLAQGWGLRAAEQGWPGGPAAEWVSEASWLPGGVGLILTFLLFPDGRFPSPRWRPVLWIGLAGFVLALPGWSLSPDRATEFAARRNPLATTAIPTDALLVVGMTLFSRPWSRRPPPWSSASAARAVSSAASSCGSPMPPQLRASSCRWHRCSGM